MKQNFPFCFLQIHQNKTLTFSLLEKTISLRENIGESKATFLL